MAFSGVAQVLVLCDDYVSITDFFQGMKAQGGDTELSHNHTATTTTKKRREEKKRPALNNTHPVVVNLWGVFIKNIPLSSSSNDLQILKRTE